MHVLFLPSWYPTKDNPVAGIFFKKQVEALINNGHQVGVLVAPIIHKIITKRNVKNISNLWSNRPFIHFEENEGVPVINGRGWTLSNKPRVRNYFLFKTGRKMFKRYITKYGLPDLIHAHSVLTGGLLASSFE